jgi:hypothetical protein
MREHKEVEGGGHVNCYSVRGSDICGHSICFRFSFKAEGWRLLSCRAISGTSRRLVLQDLGVSHFTPFLSSFLIMLSLGSSVTIVQVTKFLVM